MKIIGLSLLYIGLLIAYSFNSLAQQPKSELSYIITTRNDTVWGSFSEQYAIKPDKLSFRPAGSETYKEYGTDDIIALKTEKFFYKRVTVVQENGVSPFLFLHVLVHGNTSLYEYNEAYYLQKKGDVPILLEKNRDGIAIETTNTTQKQYVREDFRYRGLLSYLMSDCEILKTRISRLKFNVKDLSALVTAYNQCIAPDEKLQVKVKPGRIKTSYGVRAGAIFNKMEQYTPYSDSFKKSLSFNSKAGITAGIYFALTYKNKLSVQPELLITQKSGEGIAPAIIHNNTFSIRYDLIYVQLPVSAYYYFNWDKISPFISVGGGWGRIIHEDAKFRRNNSAPEEEVNLYRYEIGLRAGTGFWLKQKGTRKFGIEYTFENSETMADHPWWPLNQKSHNISIKLAFK